MEKVRPYAREPLITAILGSPRSEGATASALKWFLEGAQRGKVEAETFRVAAFGAAWPPVRICDACESCSVSGVCVYDDEPMASIYRSVEETSGLVLATPVWFEGFPAQVKAAIDRFECYFQAKRQSRARSFPWAVALIVIGGQSGGTMPQGIVATTRAVCSATRSKIVCELFFGGTDSRPLLERDGVRGECTYQGEQFAKILVTGRETYELRGG